MRRDTKRRIHRVLARMNNLTGISPIARSRVPARDWALGRDKAAWRKSASSALLGAIALSMSADWVAG